MAKLILETIQRGVIQYHKIDKLPVTIGRAYDNDIILQDMSISPHHLQIMESENGFQIHNLWDENGTNLNGKKMALDPMALKLPSLLTLGHMKARLISPDMPVEKTQVRNCGGLFCIFSSPVWSVILFLITVALFFLERYLKVSVVKEPIFYLSEVLPSILTILGITIVISGISRLSTHRWEIVPAISVASLIFLIPQLFEYLGHALNYTFTSNTPLSLLKNISSFLLIPFLLAIYMVKTNHTRWIPAIGVAALVSSPVIAYQFSDLVDKLSVSSGFTDKPGYNQTLSPYDKRLNKTISLDEYFNQAESKIDTEIQQLIKEAREKEQLVSGKIETTK